MASNTLQNVALRGVVCTVPGEPIPVETIGYAFPAAAVQRIAALVGLKQLFRVPLAGVTAGDLCRHAAQRLLQDLNWDPSTIDGLILVTETPDHVLPATACILQGQLNLPKSCLAFDVNLGCTGYVYGLSMAAHLIASGTCRRMLLLVGDTITRLINPGDRTVSLLFGDACSATALEYDAAAEPISFILGTDGTGARHLVVPAGGFRQPRSPETCLPTLDAEGNPRSLEDLYMNGWEIFHFASQIVPPLVRDTLALHGWTDVDVDAYLLHQANEFILHHLVRQMKLPQDRVPINIGKFGNTSGVSLPLLLADAVADRVKDSPTRLILAAFGVGLSWGAVALTAGPLKTATVVQVPTQAEK